MSQHHRQHLPYGVPPGTPDFPDRPPALPGQQPAAFVAAPDPAVRPPGAFGGAPAAPGRQTPLGGEQHHPGGMMSCRLCGSVPAAPATFRGHQGIVVVMSFLRTDGPFCRDCGLATFRAMTSRTLVQGWYGWASFLITPITVLINLTRRGRVARLPAPQPHPYAPSRPPMDPGPRLLHRPMTIIGLAVPFALIALVFLLASL